MDKVNVGVIGLGMIGATHIESLRRIGMAEVTAVSDTDPELLRATGDKWGVTARYTDYRDLLADGRVESVHICTPNSLHYPVAKAALLAGKHVVCEKPLVFTVEEAQELCDLARERGVVGAVVFNLRYYPLVRQARTMHLSGATGRLLSYHGAYLQDWLLLETDYSWRLEPEVGGPCRAVGDIGSHWLDMAEYVTGERIVSLCADTSTFYPVRKKANRPVRTFERAGDEVTYEDVNITTEDYAAVLFRFAGGARGSVVINQAAAGRKNRLTFELGGTSRSLGWDSEEPNTLWIGSRLSPNGQLIKDPALMGAEAAAISSLPGGHAEGFLDASKQLFLSIYGWILAGQDANGSDTPFPTFADGLRKVQLCGSILRSSEEGRWIDVE